MSTSGAEMPSDVSAVIARRWRSWLPGSTCRKYAGGMLATNHGASLAVAASLALASDAMRCCAVGADVEANRARDGHAVRPANVGSLRTTDDSTMAWLAVSRAAAAAVGPRER